MDSSSIGLETSGSPDTTTSVGATAGGIGVTTEEPMATPAGVPDDLRSTENADIRLPGSTGNRLSSEGEDTRAASSSDPSGKGSSDGVGADCGVDNPGEDDAGDSNDDDDDGFEEHIGLFQRLKQALHLGKKEREPLLDSFDLEGIATLIRSGKVKRIVCMVGAGISVNAGIPDFRSPTTGLYARLASYGLPHPEAIFELSYFRNRPEPFFQLAKELLPGTYRPTPAHVFLRLLNDKGLLQRCFTQNVDSLEAQAGVPKERVVAAHGNFDSAHCIDCRTEHSTDYVREAVLANKVCRCTKCKGLVKPDIVFFGESLPARFFSLAEQDLPEANLMIVMGTSLVVQPFASLVDIVEDDCPRLLINKEMVGDTDPMLAMLTGRSRGFNFGKGNYRDALFLGDCDEGVRRLCNLLGWGDELDELLTCSSMDSLHLDGPSKAGAAAPATPAKREK